MEMHWLKYGLKMRWPSRGRKLFLCREKKRTSLVCWVDSGLVGDFSLKVLNRAFRRQIRQRDASSSVENEKKSFVRPESKWLCAATLGLAGVPGSQSQRKSVRHSYLRIFHLGCRAKFALLGPVKGEFRWKGQIFAQFETSPCFIL